jgi:hypothetical protein
MQKLRNKYFTILKAIFAISIVPILTDAAEAIGVVDALGLTVAFSGSVTARRGSALGDV